jgi:hypothetical protein
LQAAEAADYNEVVVEALEACVVVLMQLEVQVHYQMHCHLYLEIIIQ